MSIRKANLGPRASPLIKLPFDVWHQISSYLPEVSRRTLTHLSGLQLWSDHNERDHQKVWDLIFDNYKFLEYISDCGYLCVLIGSDLQYLYNYNYNSRTALRERYLKHHNNLLNLALVILKGDQPTSVANDIGIIGMVEYFIDSAREELKRQIHIGDDRWDVPGTLKIRHRFAQEERFSIRLNIESLNRPCKLPDLPSIKFERACGALVSLKGDYLNSAYLYWKYDHKMLRIIEPTDIIGLGRYASVRGTKEFVQDVCGLKIQHPAEVPELCGHQPPCIPSFKRKRPQGWGEVNCSFGRGVFPCQIRFHSHNGPPYKPRYELSTNWYRGWTPNYIYTQARFPATYRGEKDWETDPIMEKRIELSQEL